MPACADCTGKRPAGLPGGCDFGPAERAGPIASWALLMLLLTALLAGAVRADEPPAGASVASGTAGDAASVVPRAIGSIPALNEQAALRAAQAAVGRPLPDLALLDREGRSVRLSDYRGKPLLVSFIYTGCFQVCPTQTRSLLQAVQGLDRMLGAHQFNVISIGFNQPFDTPGAMRSFSRQHRIDHTNWEFLSPPRDAVPLLTNTFGFNFVATPAGFDHLLGVTVVDAAGRIHAQVLGEQVRADQLGRPLRELLLGAAPASGSTLATVIERVRILCTVYDPETGEYRYDIKLILELIGGALFFFSAAAYLLLEWRNQRRSRRPSCTAPARASGNAA